MSEENEIQPIKLNHKEYKCPLISGLTKVTLKSGATIDAPVSSPCIGEKCVFFIKNPGADGTFCLQALAMKATIQSAINLDTIGEVADMQLEQMEYLQEVQSQVMQNGGVVPQNFADPNVQQQFTQQPDLKIEQHDYTEEEKEQFSQELDEFLNSEEEETEEASKDEESTSEEKITNEQQN